MYQKYIKRILDILCALAAMIVFCWLYAIIAILVRIKLGSPVIFRQRRPGYKEKIFTMYKFRTMSDDRDEKGDLLPDKDRLTKFGKILRSTSLDELPEAMNILKGDMSIIGPRPLAVQYLPYYTEEERHRHDVRPGLSGLAQVNGRNALQWEEKFSYDLKYVSNVTWAQDIKIVLKTVKKMLERNDVVVRGTGKTIDFDRYRRLQTKEGGLKMVLGKKIYLRAMEREDMDLYWDMINDPNISNQIVGWSFPISKYEQERWYEKAVADKKNIKLTIVDKETKKPVGMVTLSSIDWQNRSARHGMKLHTSCPKRRGIGTDAVMTLMKFAFEEVNLHRLDGSWIDYNEPSIRLYRKCGWKDEGIKKEAIYRNGSYHDLHFAGITKEEYLKVKESLG